jgi:pimeloyl-ACP methyl ester carboxylesterase
MRFRRILKRSALGAFVLVAAIAVAAAGYRSYRQHQLAEKLVISSVNGIDEQHFVEANGIEHWVTIRGLDRRNPIVFFVHGGPAEIVSFVPSATQAFERDFTVVHWDQRGAGRTFSRNPRPPADLTLAQMTDDGVKVVEWVTRHLAQPQVILVGHSWGSILGEHMVVARPDLFAAYVGTGQVVGWNVQVQTQYAYSLARARTDGDSDVLTALTAFGGPPSSDLKTYQQFRAVMRRYLAQADRDFGSRQAPDILMAPGVSLADVWNALQGARASMAALTPTLLSVDLTELGYDFPVPFVVIQGDSDLITPTSLAVDYFNRINAPAKALVQIPDAGHYAFVTHANQFREALVSKVLPLTRRATPANQGPAGARQ